jgi:hypothetical protein
VPVDRVLRLFRVDFAPAHRQPSAVRVVQATLASIAGSLLADALLVVIAQAVFPSTTGYAHFQFSDYAKLTVIGVVIACLAWPVVTRISSQPRWLFVRMAVAVTLVLWLPDVYILVNGQPARAVGFLFLMHLAIAVITYNCLVRISGVDSRLCTGFSRSPHHRAPKRGGWCLACRPRWADTLISAFGAPRFRDPCSS